MFRIYDVGAVLERSTRKRTETPAETLRSGSAESWFLQDEMTVALYGAFDLLSLIGLRRLLVLHWLTAEAAVDRGV